MGQLLRRIAAFLGIISPIAHAYPALDITLPGNRQLHLVGSIHMGTVNMSPLPARLIARLQQADALIVEADITSSSSPFGQTTEQERLEQRLSAEEFCRLQTLCLELGTDVTPLSTLPGWQVALMLQARQAQQLGLRAEYGIDYQLLQAAKAQQKPVIELEGAEEQLGMLEQLPEGGMALLHDTLEHWHTNARLLQTMMSWWLDTKPNATQETLPSTFCAELYDVLMHRRNRHWQQKLEALPPGNYVVAVGALHLYGEDNLPAMLKNR
ncbi:MULTISPECIES: TraB/GumN family protein [unclassified Serratia (in: enterobacteria)]|uniref:TraB/GumN family protein n=1 Tax=unclassified Serratia (in: enterobacteria) TaxID=2647522 RepID=UPI000506E855|nr:MULTISPECIES: TraB/GumN family protein [unclassified Serratia (in: enterobacteria)]KFK97544.1 conjugal transfer protein TraB [Serratia sp. Ag2]KFK98148.1 conjugal transfer protein TraB [Serratia sp. Ag1]